jgi:ribose transport system ATP-binding protein
MPLPSFPPLHLQLDKITKVYPGVVALQDVSLSLSSGEVVGLIGENGAGKSTLMKVLAGTITPTSGQIILDGQTFPSLTPAGALSRGIAFVHQELNPFTNLDVAGNILLGRELVSGPLRLLDPAAMARRVQPVLDRLGATFGPNDNVADLSMADLQLLEIAKALSMKARIVIFDEPTSSLTISETRRLMDIIAGLKADGVGVLFISHRLAEVEACADRVVSLRDGRNAGELARAEISKERMIRMMIGRDLALAGERSKASNGQVLLHLDGVGTPTWPNAHAQLQVHEGEIVGLAGLVGSGRTELARVIFGIDKATQGKISVYGKSLSSQSVGAAIAAGLCLVPEDRKEQGLLLDFSIAENIALPSLGRLSHRGVVSRRTLAALANRFMARLSIRTKSSAAAAAELSGGNQQKVVLAKWLSMAPKVIILDEPTRGIDVGSKAEIYRLMRELTRAGVGILMISSDMEEVIAVSDRVAVMRAGEIVGQLTMDELSEHAILSLAVG